MTFVCNTATFTLIVFMLQITELKEQYLNILASCNYDKDSFLLEFLSAVFSLLVIMLQTNSSLYFGLLSSNLEAMGKVNNSGHIRHPIVQTIHV